LNKTSSPPKKKKKTVCGYPGSNRGVLFLKLANLPPNFRPEKKKRKDDFGLFKGFLMEKMAPIL
jgi:hypothetical protein